MLFKSSLKIAIKSALSIKMTQKVDTALVLCAGFGTRLRPLTDKMPKPLLPINGRPLLFSILDKLIAAGIENFFINIHHLPKKFAETFGIEYSAFAKSNLAHAFYKGCSATLVFEPQILDTGGAIKNLLPFIDCSKPLAVHNGDILSESPATDFLSVAKQNLADENCAATLCVRSGGNLANVAIDANCDVCDMRFILGNPYDRLVQYSGFNVLNPPIYKFFAMASAEKFSIIDTFLTAACAGKRVAASLSDEGAWADIGTRGEFTRINAGGLPDKWSALALLCDNGFEPDNAEIAQIAKGASTRKFFKFAHGGKKYAACFYEPMPRENFLYAPIAEFLKTCAIPVPAVAFHDADKRILIMEDAGSHDLSEVATGAKKNVYFQALRAAKKLHICASASFSNAQIELCAPFDDALYDWEQNYFYNECVVGAFELSLPRPESEFVLLKRELKSGKQALLFRDFQSQNAIVSDCLEVKIIDFQGMRWGNPFYDVASLLFDPYVEPFDETFIDAALCEYLDFIPQPNAPDFQNAKRLLHLAGAERLMQALGAYGFLSLKKNRKEYAKYFVPAARNLKRCAEACGLLQIAEIASQILDRDADK